jgi:hypothetical protein
LSRRTLLIMIFINWKRWCGMWRFIHSYTYIWPTHLHRTIYILHRLCKKYICCKALLLLLLLTSCELHPLYIRSDPCRKNSDPRLNLLEILVSCQQLVLISILLWFDKPMESIVDCIVVVIIVARVVVINLAHLITVFAEWPRICEIGF